MKKFIPFISLIIGAIFMQNCIQRDEDIRDEDIKATINVKDDLQSNLNMKSDSIKSDEGVIDPDPPVRDGDNWRLYNKY